MPPASAKRESRPSRWWTFLSSSPPSNPVYVRCLDPSALFFSLSSSDFGTYPVPNPLVTLSLTPSSRKDFFEGKNFFSHEAISRASRSPKMGEWRSVQEVLCRLFQTCRRIGVYLSSEENLHRSLTRQGLQDTTDSGNLPWVCLLRKNVSVGGVLRRMSHGPQHFESNNCQGKGCRSVSRITILQDWGTLFPCLTVLAGFGGG